jgi:hypothetical protein
MYSKRTRDHEILDDKLGRPARSDIRKVGLSPTFDANRNWMQSVLTGHLTGGIDVEDLSIFGLTGQK